MGEREADEAGRDLYLAGDVGRWGGGEREGFKIESHPFVCHSKRERQGMAMWVWGPEGGTGKGRFARCRG